MKIKFGDVVKDEITGFVGTVIAKTEWMHTTYPKFGVQSKQPNSISPIFFEWFDEPRLEKISKIKKSLDTEEELAPKKRGRKPKIEMSEVDEDRPKKKGRKIKRKRIEKELDDGQI